MANFKNIRKILLQYKFPQQVFTKELKSLIGTHENLRILDVPCGGGMIAYALSKNGKNIVEGYDLSTNLINKAQKYFKRSNLSFQSKDIFDVLNREEQFNVVCIINSLFLLPKTDELLKKVWLSLKADGKLHIIVPNINSKNFIKFQKLNPGVNSFIKDKEDLISIIQKAGFALEYQKGIVNISFYGRKELKYMYSFASFYLLSLNALSFKKLEPSYYIISFNKL